MFDVLVTDVDGVLTNGKFLYDETGKKYKEFGPHDGDGIKLLKKEGIEVVAITADKRGFPISEKRLNDMGVPLYLVTESERLNWIKKQYGDRLIGFVGDGYYDIPALRFANVGFSPKNALDVVKGNADVVLSVSGSEGVLMAVYEYYLSVKDPNRYELFKTGITN